MISTRAAAANENRAGPQPRGLLIIKPRNIQTQTNELAERPKQTKNVERITGERGHQDNLRSETERGDKLSLSEHLQLLTGRAAVLVGAEGVICLEVLDIWLQPIWGRMCGL